MFGRFCASHQMRVIFLIIVIVVALVAGVYAYLVALPPPGGPRATITSYPLEFSIELDKTEYNFEENMTITFQIKNISNETVTLTKPAYCPIGYIDMVTTEAEGVIIPDGVHLISVLFHFGLCITSENGTAVCELYSGLLPAIYDIVLEPNGYIKQKVNSALFFSGSYLSKGTYQIKGIQYYYSILGIGLITLKTPSITFIVK